MTSIKPLHVSARGRHLQEIFQNKGIQDFLEKLTGSLLVKKFPAFYGTRRLFNAFTSTGLKYSYSYSKIH